MPDKDKKVKPKRSLICILAVFEVFFIAIFPAFVIEFVRKIKRNDPERFAQISNELRLFCFGSKKRGKARCDQLLRSRSIKEGDQLFIIFSICLLGATPDYPPN